MKSVSRRRFVGMAGAPAVFAAQQEKAQSPNNKVVLALIGAGGRGSSLGANLAKVENTEFKYICEVNDQRGAEITKKLEEIRGVPPQRVTDMRACSKTKTSMAWWWPHRNTGTHWPASGHARQEKTSMSRNVLP